VGWKEDDAAPDGDADEEQEDPYDLTTPGEFALRKQAAKKKKKKVAPMSAHELLTNRRGRTDINSLQLKTLEVLESLEKPISTPTTRTATRSGWHC
jgi:hypothetical protein